MPEAEEKEGTPIKCPKCKGQTFILRVIFAAKSCNYTTMTMRPICVACQTNSGLEINLEPFVSKTNEPRNPNQ